MIYSIYGFGKMKTESAIGCTIRTIANLEKVLFVQFLKDGKSSEIAFFQQLNSELAPRDSIKILVGEIDKITLPKNITTVDKFKAQCLFVDMLGVINQSTELNLVVADEILPAVDMGLITLDQIKYLINNCKDKNIDLYMTGRVRSKELRVRIAELSDTCTDAHCVRHSFNTHCKTCDRDFPYHYTYCPDCGQELVKSKACKLGRDL